MSRIGRKPIPVPKNVEVTIEPGNKIMVKGPRGKLEDTFDPEIEIVQENGHIEVRRPSDSQRHRSLHGLTRTLVSNMVVGVSEGWKRELLIVGVGYRAQLEGQTLVLQLGFSHPVRMEPPPDVKYIVGDRKSASDPLGLTIEGNNKQIVGQQAAIIRGLRPPEPYKGKGVRYLNERIRRKAGKAGKK